jgi:predicted DNA-binding transcriptional regulator AlpA
VPLKLAGLAEVAELLGVSKRTATRYVQRPDFPEPVARLRAGPIWLEKDILVWARSEPPARPGRPLKVAKHG